MYLRRIFSFGIHIKYYDMMIHFMIQLLEFLLKSAESKVWILFEDARKIHPSRKRNWHEAQVWQYVLARRKPRAPESQLSFPEMKNSPQAATCSVCLQRQHSAGMQRQPCDYTRACH